MLNWKISAYLCVSRRPVAPDLSYLLPGRPFCLDNIVKGVIAGAKSRIQEKEKEGSERVDDSRADISGVRTVWSSKTLADRTDHITNEKGHRIGGLSSEAEYKASRVCQRQSPGREHRETWIDT